MIASSYLCLPGVKTEESVPMTFATTLGDLMSMLISNSATLSGTLESMRIFPWKLFLPVFFVDKMKMNVQKIIE